jgi:hypothetical protein
MAKSNLTEEQRAALRERLLRGREAAAAKRAAELTAKAEGGEDEPVPVGEPDSPPVTPEPEPPDEAAGERVEVKDGFTAKELADIRAAAKKVVAKEMEEKRLESLKSRQKAMLEEEVLRLRRGAGLTDHRDDLIDITIDCPPFTNRLILNFGMDEQQVFDHGFTYTVTRRQYDVLREQMARGWDAEDRAGNPNRKFYRTFAGTQNPHLHTRQLMDGTMTIGRETVVNATTGSVSGAYEGEA